jgi:hypothetical protein
MYPEVVSVIDHWKQIVNIDFDDGDKAISQLDVVPQPVLHKRSGIIFGHFCPKELCVTVLWTCLRT